MTTAATLLVLTLGASPLVPNHGIEVVAKTGSGPRLLVSDGMVVDWTIVRDIFQVTPDLGTSRAVWSGNCIFAMAVDGPDLYWIDCGGVTSSASPSGIYRRRGERPAEVLWQGAPRGSLARVGSKAIYRPIGALGLAVDGGQVFFTATNGHGTSLFVLEGKTAKVLAELPGRPWGIAVDAKDVYLNDQDVDAVWRVPRAGGAPIRIAGSGQPTDGPHRAGIAVDEQYVYWSDWSGVYRVPKKGGRSQVLAQPYRFVWSIALAHDFVYFTEHRGDAVYRVPKKGGRVELIADHQVETEPIVSDGVYIYWGVGHDGAYTDGEIRRWRIPAQ